MPLGTYSSQISGGSTTWLSQSNTGKSLLVMTGLRRRWRVPGRASDIQVWITRSEHPRYGSVVLVTEGGILSSVARSTTDYTDGSRNVPGVIVFRIFVVMRT